MTDETFAYDRECLVTTTDDCGATDMAQDEIPSPVTPSSDHSPTPGRGIPGRYVVVAMLAFGAFATAFLWLYTYTMNRPFIPLRHALAQHFGRTLAPRVEGGRDRGRGPVILRVVLKVDFDPTHDTTEIRQQRDTLEREAIRLTRQHLDLKPYETWQFVLLYYPPEKLPTRWDRRRPITEIQLDELPPAADAEPTSAGSSRSKRHPADAAQ